jgi:hypothetical protein
VEIEAPTRKDGRNYSEMGSAGMIGPTAKSPIRHCGPIRSRPCSLGIG